MPTNLEYLASIKADYLAALAADAVNPQPDYSLDGESVSQEAWRAGMWARVKEVSLLMNAEQIPEARIQVRSG